MSRKPRSKHAQPLEDGVGLILKIKTTFVGWHHWPLRRIPKAMRNELTLALSKMHRHVFHVCVGFPATHADRQREFLTEQAKLQKVIHSAVEVHMMYPSNGCDWSCEQIARRIAMHMEGAHYVAVSEDGENGAMLLSQNDCDLRTLLNGLQV